MDTNRISPLRALVALALLLLPVSKTLRAQDGIEGAARRAATGKVRPGDRIDLHFMRERELSGSINVNERGDAVFPKLGTLNVSQVTIAELQDSLRVRYSEYLRTPELEVTVLRRVVVNGEVKMPNVYLVDIASTVRDAIAKAGGVLETGNKNNVAIIRGSQRIRVKGWDRSDGPATDLQSGDQIVVGRKNWLVLNALPVISTGVIVIGLIRSLK
jgi:protein involved in polysaccharide export with SLBB domain